MKLPDVNVLLYAVNSASPQHAVAKQALREAFEQGEVGLPWAVLLGFLRLSTRTGILSRPLPVEQGLLVLHSWLDHPAAVALAPSDRHAAILGRLLIGAGQGGPLVSDAHLAALAIEHNAELLSFDRDFARFAGLRWTCLA
ncbi:PIN domain-containing protein [Aquincola sp. S2]|uniref:Ribonuclease VapC n=1 Tax=Pseudaquabacterium terrae TaxID=2732868 RepID=A0ABX2EUM4_9BURK|nr:TA system VapC family ribonuclease toxin [Aquabacterium terrae]NRF72336.1 PIN domain-containing protein [Aquabacterium terrae]